MNERDLIVQTAERIKQALMENDLKTLRELYTEDYEGIDVRGGRDNLELILQAYKPGAVKLEQYHVEDMQVDVSTDIGIIRGRGRIRGTFQGHVFAHVVRFTDIYKKSDGKWKCYRSHLTEITENDS